MATVSASGAPSHPAVLLRAIGWFITSATCVLTPARVRSRTGEVEAPWASERVQGSASRSTFVLHRSARRLRDCSERRMATHGGRSRRLRERLRGAQDRTSRLPLGMATAFVGLRVWRSHRDPGGTATAIRSALGVPSPNARCAQVGARSSERELHRSHGASWLAGQGIVAASALGYLAVTERLPDQLG